MFKKINWPEGTSSDTWNTMTEDCAEVIHDMLNNTPKSSSKDSILAPFLSILTFQLPRAVFENVELVSFVTWFQLATRINRLFLYHWRNSFHNSRWMHGCRIVISACFKSVRWSGSTFYCCCRSSSLGICNREIQNRTVSTETKHSV